MKIATTTCFFVLFSALLPTFVVAGLSIPPVDFVVLIGIDHYDSSELRPLQYAKSDAKSFKEALLRCGFNEKTILVMTDDAEDASLKPTKDNILDILEKKKHCQK